MTYKGKIVFSALTSNDIDSVTLDSAGGKDVILSQVLNGFKENLSSEFIKKCLEQNVVVYGVDVSNVNAEYKYQYSKYLAGRAVLKIDYYKLEVSGELNFEVDKPFMESPVADWILWVISKAISAIITIVIAYFIVQAVKEWLISMTTTLIEVYYYDQYGNLTKKEVIQNPSPFGISLVGIFMIILLIILLFWFVGKPKGR